MEVGVGDEERISSKSDCLDRLSVVKEWMTEVEIEQIPREWREALVQEERREERRWWDRPTFLYGPGWDCGRLTGDRAERHHRI